MNKKHVFVITINIGISMSCALYNNKCSFFFSQYSYETYMWFSICYLDPAHPKPSITHPHNSSWIHVKRCPFCRKSMKYNKIIVSYSVKQHQTLFVYRRFTHTPSMPVSSCWTGGEADDLSGWRPRLSSDVLPDTGLPANLDKDGLQHEHYTASLRWLYT